MLDEVDIEMTTEELDAIYYSLVAKNLLNEPDIPAEPEEPTSAKTTERKTSPDKQRENNDTIN